MSNSRHLPPEALDDWLAAAAARLGLDPGDIDIATVLNVARDVAHGVARPAAPLSTFLLGVAMGRATAAGEDASSALAARAAAITALAEGWDGGAG
ncbi:DUF6457 domain-containing protein [Leucobacter tenebrionis]|uniref:DUF6457 domain-containing protein n=1 Tax=Leucobacter tenebrionis TaxID=2873270 RepID=UPI001CA73D38|nr:DUF6457 domain-containing protein [Leucobacter tenebrionis]QZY52841.1 DUF6457 domain-containing protein [Leucobacter tenebrionis]